MTRNAIVIAGKKHRVGHIDRAYGDASGYNNLTVRFDDGVEVEAWSPISMIPGGRVIVEISTPTIAQREACASYGVTLPEREYRVMGEMAF